ncbi:MAG: phenylalanine--tRNA ligase subunit alpha [Candidatus Aenigmatarchaeota archaeon]|nr:MAG: phenylalanine--tRNA ligase subunit alpha [Candidatus Aenigmarchaeota archaeon]
MNVQGLLETLHPLERKILPFLKDGIELKDLAEKSRMKNIEAMRALQWLENKGVVKIKSSLRDVVQLGENGRIYEKRGLPEKRFLEVLEGKMDLESIKKAANLDNNEVRISLGLLKSRYAITILGDDVETTSERERVLKKGFPEEKFLKKLPAPFEDLSDEERNLARKLLKRKDIITKESAKLKHVKLTETGKKLVKKSKFSKLDLIEKLTPKMLKERKWAGKKFRRYDVEINVPRVYGGRRHFVNQAVDYAKRVWLDLGFKEMTGPLLQTSFWNFDALFTAQDHPVRDLQDTFYIKDPERGKLPNPKIVKAVKDAHENGGGTGSKGWQYKWDPMDAKRNCMRTHTTCLSAKTIASLRSSDLPAKFFAVGKCFRNETMDWNHLFEFNQFEGIVVDPDANFKHLLSYLKNFANKIGFTEVRFRPAHFPYTEPSVEGQVFDPVHKQWIEVFAAGVFRPELVVPLLGKVVPVMAWGPGLDRMTLSYYNIKDLRELYKNDLKRLREIKVWLK